MRLKKYFLIALGVMLCFPFAKAAEPFTRDIEDARLQTLTSDLHPAVYLVESAMKVYSDNPVVLFVDAESVQMLTQEQEVFEEIELISFKVTSEKDESAKIDVSQLNGFSNLKYFLLTYEYEACGGGDACLDKKADATITLPADSDVEVYYLLSIPE